MALKDLYKTYPANGRVDNRTYVFPNTNTKYDTTGQIKTPTPTPTPSPVPTTKKPIFSSTKSKTGTFDNSEFINPATGNVWTDEEYADSIAQKASGASIPTYAGNAITKPDQSVEDLTKTAKDLNMVANDIATGERDPYKIASQSGIQYTPAELKAIESAYAGVFDPALNDVFAKLDAKQKEEEKKTEDAQWKERQIFATNENIRQWRATTGTKSSSADDDFTDTQRNKGAANAGMTISEFNKLDPDIKNFYINPPKKLDPETNKQIPQYQIFEDAYAKVRSGDMDPEELTQQITDSTTLPEAVKHYFIEQIPIAPEKKEGYFAKIWSAIKGE